MIVFQINRIFYTHYITHLQIFYDIFDFVFCSYLHMGAV